MVPIFSIPAKWRPPAVETNLSMEKDQGIFAHIQRFCNTVYKSTAHGLASSVKRMVVADETTHVAGPSKKRPRLSLKSERKTNAKEDSQGDFGPQLLEYQGVTPLDLNETISHDDMDGEAMTEMERDPESSLQESGLPCDVPRIPPVASLENIGNTCYLNSMLEILRYTPSFLEGLEELYHAIIDVEKKKKDLRMEDEEEEELKPCLQLSKQLYLLYKRMEKMEERYAEVASSDVSSMAVRPDKVLDIIRKLNCMFEGCLQQDAQELLHCLLAALREAEDELHKLQVELLDKELALYLRDSSLPKSPKRSPRLQKIPSPQRAVDRLSVRRKIFGPSKLENIKEVDIDACSESVIDSPDGGKGQAPASLMNGVGRLVIGGQAAECCREQMSQSAAVDSPRAESCRSERVSPVKGRTARRGRKFGSALPKRQLTFDSVDASAEAKRCRTDFELTGSKSQTTIPSLLARMSGPGRRLGMRGAVVRKDGAPATETLSTECRSVSQISPNTEGRNGDDGSDDVVCTDDLAGDGKEDEQKADVADNCEKPCRSNGTPDGKRMPSPDSKRCLSPTKRVASLLVKNSSFRLKNSFSGPERCSPAEQFLDTVPSKNCAMGISGLANFNQSNSSSRLQPMLKLEKCDFVCRESGQSVNFREALRHLSPAKGQEKRSRPLGDLAVGDNRTYGSTCTFKSVPMKKALVKVEKCDSVCGSPAKSVDAKYAERCLSGTTVPKREFVKQLFMGNMFLRTRCLECETCRDRVEEFQDISVPLRHEHIRHSMLDDDSNDKPIVLSEDETDSQENENSCLSKLMAAFSAVELLSGDNKYKCEVCLQMTEAERSIHYKHIPDILVLQLKRFSATAGCIASLSKINDHVDIPLTLPCLRQCVKPCSKPEHRYMLFGVVTHAGSTICNGHYLSYVKVCPNSTGRGSDVRMRIADFLCSDTEVMLEGGSPQYQWLGCDDETIRIHSEDEFHNMLAGIGGCLVGNPYILFYHRMNNQRSNT